MYKRQVDLALQDNVLLQLQTGTFRQLQQAQQGKAHAQHVFRAGQKPAGKNLSLIHISGPGFGARWEAGSLGMWYNNLKPAAVAAAVSYTHLDVYKRQR